MQMAMGKSLQVEIRETNSCYYIAVSTSIHALKLYRSLEEIFGSLFCLFVCYGFYQRPSKLGPV